ncbi:hypothetical protein DFS33DRAFT_1377554 [Desarmillaria ectypa]|nr:hypothetical protein DFS33DRAFT_1377554 [Desarmillaria ectypa]
MVKPGDIVGVNVSGSYYDDIMYMHIDMNHKIHFTGLFFPWHRWYVQMYENALKNKCGYKGTSPYWNWAFDSSDVNMSTIFDPDPKSSLGGWGLPSQDVHVQDGGFGVYTTFRLSYPSYHPLRRNFTIRPFLGLPLDFFPNQELLANSSFTLDVVHDLVHGYEGDFKGLQTNFEFFTGAHESVHEILGGDLGGICPSDSTVCQPGPTFSANVDQKNRYFGYIMRHYDWQNANELNARAFEGGSVQILDNVTVYKEYPNVGPPNLHDIAGPNIDEQQNLSMDISTKAKLLPPKPDLTFTRPPKSKVALLFWRWRMWFESTFVLSMLEPWEKIMLLTILFICSSFVLSAFFKYIRQDIGRIQQHAMYYLFGQEEDKTAIWHRVNNGAIERNSEL